MRIAVFNAAGEVENVILADEEFAKAQGYPAYKVLSDGQWCDLGATWDGKKFTPPEAP